MKFKNFFTLILLACFIAIISSSKAQTRDYIPMLNEGAVWFETYTDYNLPPSPYGYNHAAKLYFQGDTTFNDMNYLKLYKAFVDLHCQEMMDEPLYSGALREDTLGQKVWIVEYDQSEEVLFFDFSLNEGDSIPESCYFSKNFYPLTIDNIDTVTTYDGLERRKWQFNHDGWPVGGSEVIEGIGSINGLIAGFIVPNTPYWEELFCFAIDSSNIYPNPNPFNCVLPSDTCMTVGMANREIKDDILIYPNPVLNTQQLHLENITKEGDEIAGILLIDTKGTLVLGSETYQNHTQINLPNYLTGFYILKIITKKHVYIKKIKIQ